VHQNILGLLHPRLQNVDVRNADVDDVQPGIGGIIGGLARWK